MINVDDDAVQDVLAQLGAPYCWGAGTPKSAKFLSVRWDEGMSPATLWPRGVLGGFGWDCSGFAQACLVRFGRLLPSAPDRTAAGLFDLSDIVDLEHDTVVEGDLAFYGTRSITHVMVVIGPDLVIGPTRGGSKTNGDDPNAFVRVERPKYRTDFRGIRRLRRA